MKMGSPHTERHRDRDTDIQRHKDIQTYRDTKIDTKTHTCTRIINPPGEAVVCRVFVGRKTALLLAP